MKPLSKIRKSARGQDCEVRIPGVCCFDPEKTVLGHKNGAGLAMKESDFLAAYICSDCHSVVDGHNKSDFSYDEILIMFYEGIFRTQKLLIEQGLVVIKQELLK